MTTDLVQALRAVVGEAHVLTEADMRATYETDWTRRYHGESLAVVRPGSAEEVSRVLQICGQVRAAVVPQGGNTGLVGGGVPRGGEVVLSLTRLNAIADFDTTSGEITVEAGATLAALQQQIRPEGWAFGVDLASRDSATIGGMVGTNAGGIRVIRYGSMRRQMLGFEAVLADGSIVRRLPGLVKDNTGYDLGQLLAGSEGTLAVVTAVRLKLVPQLQQRTVALLGVPDLAAALGVVAAVRAAMPSLEAAEAFFAEGVDLVCAHAGVPLPFGKHPGCYVLVETAARRDDSAELAEVLSECPGVEHSALATDAAGRERLWAYRERHTEAINAEGIPHKLDVTLPLSNLPEFERRVRDAIHAVRPSARPILFGHAGDGNLHVNILGLEPEDEVADDAVLRLVAELGGSISAEHGIGIAKLPWLELTRSKADIAAMRAIKRALDPRGILNPGVILPPE
ncbi:MAG: FAD-binding oxidoreductase [Dehalococcoidia bacterium]